MPHPQITGVPLAGQALIGRQNTWALLLTLHSEQEALQSFTEPDAVRSGRCGRESKDERKCLAATYSAAQISIRNTASVALLEMD